MFDGKKFLVLKHELPEGSYGIEDILHLIGKTLKGITIVFEEKIKRIIIEKKGRLELTDT